MQFAHLFFWLLAAGAIFASIMVVLPRGKSPLYGALALIVSFVFVSGLYVLLFAHTMAVLQILVYAGAIMVLFMFVIMLLNLSKRELSEEKRAPLATGLGVLALLALAGAGTVVVNRSADEIGRAGSVGDGFGTIEQMGELLFKQYLFPFELTAILLLVAVIGAVVLAKRTL